MRLLFFIIMPFVLSAQAPTTLTVWPPGAVPYALDNDTIIERTNYTDDSLLIVSDIRVPTLTMYLPDPAKATGQAVLIIPGGAYWVVATDHEGEDVARFFTERGIAAFTLKYRLPDPRLWYAPYQAPLDDARQSMRLIRENHKKWGIDPKKVGVVGFSAGGHLASTLCTHTDKNATQTALTRPDWAVLVYPVITFGPQAHAGSRERLLGPDANKPEKIAEYSNELRVDAATPPTILIHSMDDEAVPYANSVLYADALRRHGVPAELHLFESGGHGYGLANNLKGTVTAWPELVAAWAKRLQAP
jgi:acetyl esterase/lipase